MRKNIRYIIVSPNSDWGGGEQSLWNFLSFFPCDLKKKTLVMVPFNGAFYERLRSEGYNLYPFYELFLCGKKIGHLSKLFFWLKGLFLILRSNNVNWVYFNGLQHSEWTIIIVKKIMKKKIITHVRNVIGSIDVFKRIALEESDRIVAISDTVKNSLPNLFHNKTEVMFNIAVNPFPKRKLDIPFSVKNRNYQCAIFSRISPEKGQLDFLKIARYYLLKKRNMDFHVYGSPLYGSEKYFHEVKDYVRRHDMKKNVVIHGYRENVLGEIAQMDCVFCCSRNEPLGRVVMESMALGRVVIANRSGGPLELISHKENGFLVNTGNPEEAIYYLYYCQDHPEKMKTMSVNANLFSERMFSPKPYVKRWLEIANSIQ